MLRKLNRITRDKDFKKIFKRSKKIDTKNLVIRVVKNETREQKGSRFGFVVSNKVNKRATRRNALKRRLRAAIREIMSSIDSNIDVVILVKSDFQYPYEYQDIKKQIEEGLKKTLRTKP